MDYLKCLDLKSGNFDFLGFLSSINYWVNLTRISHKHTFAVKFGLFLCRFEQPIAKISEPLRLYFVLDVSIDVIQNGLYILYGLIYGFLFFNYLSLAAGSHHGGLFDHLHHFLFIPLGLYFLLFVVVAELELAGVGLHFVCG